MRRLLAIWSAVGLLCGALGCHHYGGGGNCVHGRCDCWDGPEYGCHYEAYGHDHGHAFAPAPVARPAPTAEPLKEMPKDVAPKDKED
jgi:hypothetical protein